MNFKSDNITAVSPEIMEAIHAANHGTQPSYGADAYSETLKKTFSEVFEKEVSVYLTNTGTAANSLSLASLVKPYETVYCHREAHINTDECGAPELYTGGVKLIPISGACGKMDISHLQDAISTSLSLRPHAQKPGCMSLTQATECGTVYTLEELKTLSELAKSHTLPLHMDGARFANSLVALGCTPAELTWKTGIDVMSFGATKNGAMTAEAVIFFTQKYAENFDYLHKRAGQLMSKTRFFSCQFLAYLKNDLWLKNARHANGMARQLQALFMKYALPVASPVEVNEVFITLPPSIAHYLQSKGCGFYAWELPGSNLYRFVTSCFTTEDDLNSFDRCLSEVFKESLESYTDFNKY